MRIHPSFDRSRRALLGGSAALAFTAVLKPWHAPAQTGGGKLPIGVIGSGRIGGTMGEHWVKAGHEVMFTKPLECARALHELAE